MLMSTRIWCVPQPQRNHRPVALVMLSILLSLAAVATTLADDAKGVVGVWWIPMQDAKIAIQIKPDGTLTGRVIAGNDADRRDSKNPTPELRGRRVIGITVLSAFRPEAEGLWSHGAIYEPQSGRTYTASLKLRDANHLVLRGFIGISFFGRSQTWERVSGTRPEGAQPGEPTLVYESHE